MSEEKILGYRPNGTPIHPLKPGSIATACVISCHYCRKIIRGMGGPILGALCPSCHNEKSVKTDE